MPTGEHPIYPVAVGSCFSVLRMSPKNPRYLSPIDTGNERHA
jgi:hypothetical protein